MGKPLVRFCEGSGYNSDHGRDTVAPPGNQAANREHKLRPTARGVPGLLETLVRSTGPVEPFATTSAASSRKIYLRSCSGYTSRLTAGFSSPPSSNPVSAHG